MWKLLTLVTLLQTSATTPPAPAPGPSAAPRITAPAEIVTKVQTYYDSTQKLKSHFRQVYTNTVFGKKSQSDGVVMVKKPGMMRWDYKKPEAKYFISDGQTLWVYEPTNKQAFKQNLKDQLLPVAITFLYGGGRLDQDFNATLDTKSGYGTKEDYVLKLTPKTPSAQYKHLWLVVDAADFHVRESIILEATDNVNHFKFYNVRLNDDAKFADKHFKFQPPKGVKIIQNK